MDTITQLQAQLEATESKVIDVEIVKSRAIDIRSRVSSTQQSLLNKIGEFRKNCLLINQISENLVVKERSAEAAQVVFQEAVLATNNRFWQEPPGFPLPNRQGVIFC
jgi:hypothetical protein